MPSRHLFAALFLMLGGCQSHRAAMEIVCNATTECSGCNAADPSERASRLAEYISTRVTNEEAIQMFGAVAAMDPAQRAGIVRDAASREGITQCPMAEEWARAAALTE